MAFSKVGTLDGHGAPVLRKVMIGNSVTITVMDSVKLSSGVIALGTAGASVFGHVEEIVGAKDLGMITTGAAGAALGSYIGTFTTGSANTTTGGQVAAVCDVSQTTLYSAEVDDTIGTTTGSNLAGYRMDLVDEDTLDESTAATTTAQYATWGVDPNNTAQAVVSIFESQVFNT